MICVAAGLFAFALEMSVCVISYFGACRQFIGVC